MKNYGKPMVLLTLTAVLLSGMKQPALSPLYHTPATNMLLSCNIILLFRT